MCENATSSSLTDMIDFFSATTCALNSAGGLSNIYRQEDNLNNFVLSDTRQRNILRLEIWFGKHKKKGLLIQAKF